MSSWSRRQSRFRADPHYGQPLLEDKLQLASTLASSLFSFHLVGWLHENFHPKNIVFLASPSDRKCGISSSSSSIIREPYVVGFHKSWLAGESWETEGLEMDDGFLCYLHPRYLDTKRFSVSYDYYSFGLMLLEIGLWWPASAWARKQEYLTMNPEELRQQLVKTYVPRLGPRMGSVYQRLVELCLTDGLLVGEPSSVNGQEDQNAVGGVPGTGGVPVAILGQPFPLLNGRTAAG